MSALNQAVDDYVMVRRALGFKLARHAILLHDFVDYIEAAGACRVTTELALAWATQPGGADPPWRGSKRLGVVRGFARHMLAIDPATEVPSTDLLPCRESRTTPYLYSDADVAALMAAARALVLPLRATTYETLIGLVKVTGMRSGEAIRLDRDDVDWAQGVLTIRDSKFHKSREIPLHPGALDALGAYARLRDECCPRPKAPNFFVSMAGTRLLRCNVERTFQVLVASAGLGQRPKRRNPRLHDLRHTFAVTTLLGWYRDGLDVEARLPLLSTFLGHTKPANTYWYLSAVPELMSLAAERLGRTQGARP